MIDHPTPGRRTVVAEGRVERRALQVAIADLLGGVKVIKSTFADGKPMLAIPNYAQLNRGGRSLVWIKDK